MAPDTIPDTASTVPEAKTLSALVDGVPLAAMPVATFVPVWLVQPAGSHIGQVPG